jgi:RluA family pseudouridine synthase
MGGGRATETQRGVFIARGVRVVHEDADVIVVDKPVGMVTADPARAAGPGDRARPSAREGETLFDYVKKHVRAGAGPSRGARRSDGEGRERVGRVWVIHRLDKEASGLLVFAKTERAFESLKEQFRSKSANRLYLALAEGAVGKPGDEGMRESMIAEDRGPAPANFKHRGARDERPEDGGRRLAVTRYRVIGAANGLTLLRVKLETGRKNQIRIHMQELGHPLVGDRRFGAKGDAIGRLGLHAAELGFEHPGSGEPMRFESPAPVSFFNAVGLKPERGFDVADGASDGALAARPGKGAAETSWNEVAGWYDTMLEDKGNDHYEQVILPGAISLLDPKPGMRVLDVACGQGILCRRLAALGVHVTGVDAAPQLIEAARERSPKIEYHEADARQLGPLKLTGFDAAVCVMALSNIEPIGPALAGIASALKPAGSLVIVITHPAFRAPGESHWGWDEKRKRQYRRIDAYLTPFRKDVKMHPGKASTGKSGGELETPTFHRPLSEYVRALAEAGFAVMDLREWPSERAATSGPRAPEENRARLEIPLFLGIRAIKLSTA